MEVLMAGFFFNRARILLVLSTLGISGAIAFISPQSVLGQDEISTDSGKCSGAVRIRQKNLLAPSVNGAGNIKNEVFNLLAEAYSAKSKSMVYQPYRPLSNMGRILKRLDDFLNPKEFDELNLSVVFLLYEKGYSSGVPGRLTLAPKTHREYRPIWKHHVVLLIGAEVFDIQSHSSRPLPYKDYLARYFPNLEYPDRWKNLMGASVLPSEYLQSFERIRQIDPSQVEHEMTKKYLALFSTENGKQQIQSIVELMGNN